MKEVLLLTCLSGLKSFIYLVSYSGEDLWNLNMKYFILFPFILKKKVQHQDDVTVFKNYVS